MCEKVISNSIKELGFKKVKPVEQPTPQAIRKHVQYCIIHKYDKFSVSLFVDEAVAQLQAKTRA